MTNQTRMILLSALLMGAATARATTHAWMPNVADPDNVLTNSCHTDVSWATMEQTPGAHTVNVNIDADTLPSADSITVTLPTDYETATVPNLSVASGKKLTFDSSHKLNQRDLTADEVAACGYPDYAWELKLRGKNFLVDAVGTYYNPNKYGGFVFDNAKFTVDATASNVDRFDLDRGTLNFYNPDGTNLGQAYVYFLSGSVGLMCYFNVHAGSTLKMPTCFVYDYYGKSCVTIDGGADHYINNYEIRAAQYAGVLREHTLRITGAGTRATFGVINYAKTGANHRYRLEVLDGAEISTWNVYGNGSDSQSVIMQMNDAKVTIGSTASKVNFHATNTVFESSESLTFSDCEFHARGVTFGSASTITFASPAGTFRDCVITNKSGHLYFSNESTVRSDLLFENTVLSSADSLVFGHSNGADDRVIMREGSDFAAKGDINLGDAGNARLRLEDGTLAAKNLYLQAPCSVPTTNVFVQTGGKVTLSENGAYLCCGYGVEPYCELVISNGVFNAPLIAGGANCHARNADRTGIAVVRLHGGTFNVTADDKDILNSLSHLYVGGGSPVIVSDFAATISQSLENEPGEDGEVILAGSGLKVLTGKETTVSRLVVREGTVRFGSGSRATSTLVVEKGGTVEFTEDPSQIGFAGIELKGGVINLTSGQTLAISGGAVIESARVCTPYAAPSTNVVMTASGDVSASSRTAWALATPTDYTVTKSYAYDSIEEGGIIKFREIVLPLARQIELNEGTSNATENVTLDAPYATMSVNVAGGANLTMSGTVTGGTMGKTGEGMLRLVNLALWSLDGCFYLRKGTFNYVGDGSEEVFAQPFVIAAQGESWRSVAIRNDSPLVITNVENRTGVLVKSGVGKLTIAPASGTSVSLVSSSGSDSGNMDPKAPREFGDISAADWVPPSTNATMSLSVVEGELVFRGDATTRIDTLSVLIGARATGAAANAGLVVDGCKSYLASKAMIGGTSDRYIEMGYELTDSEQQFRNPYLMITNNAEVATDVFIFGRLCGTYVESSVLVDDSTWNIGTKFSPSYCGNVYGKCRFRNRAMVYTPMVVPYGQFEIGIDGSVFAKDAQFGGIEFDMHYNNSRIDVSNDSVVAFAKLVDNLKTGTALTLNFAGGTWHTPSNWQTLRTSRHSSWAINTLTEGGLTFPVEEGRTLYAAHAIRGDGGIVKTGEGRLEFETAGEWENSTETQNTKTALADPQTVKFLGPIDVREGSVKIWNTAGRAGGTYRTAEGASLDFDGATLSSATLAGEGAFANAAVTGGTLGLTLKDDGTLEGTPSLTGITFGGETVVDFGRTTALGGKVTGLVVANFPNGAPDISNWRGRNTGRGSQATFRVDGNSVLADVERKGLILIIK